MSEIFMQWYQIWNVIIINMATILKSSMFEFLLFTTQCSYPNYIDIHNLYLIKTTTQFHSTNPHTIHYCTHHSPPIHESFGQPIPCGSLLISGLSPDFLCPVFVSLCSISTAGFSTVCLTVSFVCQIFWPLYYFLPHG